MTTRTLQCAIAGAVACLAALTAFAQSPAEVTLTRFECSGGAGPADIGRFSDTMAYEGKKLQLTASCYLIRHADHYMIWDTGYPAAAAGATPAGPTVKVPLVEQLAQLKIKPEQINYVGISHYHGDHTGQAASFPQATLLIGQGDWDVLKGPTPSGTTNAAPLQHWLGGAGKAEPVAKDKDVFGDGTVVMLDMPGHTPGHHSLLVKLKDKGNVLLTGDQAHFRENYESNGVPTFNFNRADTLASFDRFKQIAKNLSATVIIQHDPRDIDKLPAFPAAAK
ncbi:MAG TPA: N-acyl homoserine lactonase family protein [Steroidobacteraceae bacterium]|nr:N-acyl homoserine lactonase family protein [Steroidobacteraceae bacterium]